MFMSCTLIYIFTVLCEGILGIKSSLLSSPPFKAVTSSATSPSFKSKEIPLLLPSPNPLLRTQRTELMSRRDRAKKRTDHTPWAHRLRTLGTLPLLLSLNTFPLLLQTCPTTPLQLHTRNPTILPQLLHRTLPSQHLRFRFLKPFYLLHRSNVLNQRTKPLLAFHQRTISPVIRRPTHDVLSITLAPFPAMIMRQAHAFTCYHKGLCGVGRIFAFVRAR